MTIIRSCFIAILSLHLRSNIAVTSSFTIPGSGFVNRINRIQPCSRSQILISTSYSRVEIRSRTNMLFANPGNLPEPTQENFNSSINATSNILREEMEIADFSEIEYDPEKVGKKDDFFSEREVLVGDPQIKVKKKEKSVSTILQELAAIQKQGPKKYCILGTRHCSYLHQQIIELL